MLDWPDLDVPELDDDELDRTLELAKKRSHALRTRRVRRRSIIAAITLSLTVALVGATVLAPDGPRGSARHLVAAPSWKLVSDVGPSWHVVSPTGYESGFGLTCPTTTTCYAGSLWDTRVEVTHDGGATWQRSTFPADITRTSGFLDCTDVDTCSLLGQDSSGNGSFLTTDDGGQTWSSQPGPWHVSTPSIEALSCSTAASCLAVVSPGSEIARSDAGASGTPSGAFVTTDGGQSWSESDLPQGFVALTDQCLAGGACLVVGVNSGSSPQGAAFYSADGGSTWSPASVPTGTGPLNSLSCSDGGVCFVTAFGDWTYNNRGAAPSEVLVTTDGGQSWSATNTGDLPNSFLTSISCPSSSDCWASGVIGSGSIDIGNEVVFGDLEGLLATTANQGQSWQTSQLPADVRAVGGVSCPTTTTCFALGFQKPPYGNGGFVFLSYSG